MTDVPVTICDVSAMGFVLARTADEDEDSHCNDGSLISYGYYSRFGVCFLMHFGLQSHTLKEEVQ